MIVIQVGFLFSILTLKPLDSSYLSVTEVRSGPGHPGSLCQSCFIFTRSHRLANGQADRSPSAGQSPWPADLATKGFSIVADNHCCSASITLVLMAEEGNNC